MVAASAQDVAGDAVSPFESPRCPHPGAQPAVHQVVGVLASKGKAVLDENQDLTVAVIPLKHVSLDCNNGYKSHDETSASKRSTLREFLDAAEDELGGES